jgi:hypothetical protein
MEHQVEVVANTIQLLAIKGRDISTWLKPVLGPSSPFPIANILTTQYCYPPKDLEASDTEEPQLSSLCQEMDILACSLVQLVQLQMTTSAERKTVAQRMGANMGSQGKVAPLEQQLTAAMVASPATLGLMELCAKRINPAGDIRLGLVGSLTEGLLSKEDRMAIRKGERALHAMWWWMPRLHASSSLLLLSLLCTVVLSIAGSCSSCCAV